MIDSSAFEKSAKVGVILRHDARHPEPRQSHLSTHQISRWAYARVASPNLPKPLYTYMHTDSTAETPTRSFNGICNHPPHPPIESPIYRTDSPVDVETHHGMETEGSSSLQGTGKMATKKAPLAAIWHAVAQQGSPNPNLPPLPFHRPHHRPTRNLISSSASSSPFLVRPRAPRFLLTKSETRKK